MNPKLLIAPFALVSIAALAACEQAPQQPTPAPTTPTVDVTPPPAVETPLTDAQSNLNDAMESLQEAGQSLSEAAGNAMNAAGEGLAEAQAALQAMSADVQTAVGTQVNDLVTDLEARRDAAVTDEQKAAAVADTRTRAEGVAQAAGLSQAQIDQAGDAAENAARRVLGYEGPLPPV